MPQDESSWTQSKCMSTSAKCFSFSEIWMGWTFRRFKMKGSTCLFPTLGILADPGYSIHLATRKWPRWPCRGRCWRYKLRCRPVARHSGKADCDFRMQDALPTLQHLNGSILLWIFSSNVVWLKLRLCQHPVGHGILVEGEWERCVLVPAEAHYLRPKMPAFNFFVSIIFRWVKPWWNIVW